MKHVSAMASLAREHRLALLVAQALERNAPPDQQVRLPLDPSARRDAIDRLAQTHFLPQFVFEEQVFEAHARGHSALIDAQLARLRAGHRALRADIRKIRDARAPSDEDFDLFARRFEQHLKFEETELLPLLDSLPERVQDDLERALSRFGEYSAHPLKDLEQ